MKQFTDGFNRWYQTALYRLAYYNLKLIENIRNGPIRKVSDETPCATIALISIPNPIQDLNLSISIIDVLYFTVRCLPDQGPEKSCHFSKFNQKFPHKMIDFYFIAIIQLRNIKFNYYFKTAPNPHFFFIYKFAMSRVAVECQLISSMFMSKCNKYNVQFAPAFDS